MLVPPTAPYPLYAHELETGTLLVAERVAGEVVGFGASMTRGERWFLADLFVAPEHHSSGAGRLLLEALIETDAPGPVRATMASDDPRAISLYTRLGMAPRWPCFSVVGLPHRVVPMLGSGTTEPYRCPPSDLVDLATSSGYSLDQRDLAYWQRTVGAETFLIGGAGEPIGGGVIRWSTPFSIAHPDSISIGPLFARSTNDIADVVAAVIDLVRDEQPEHVIKLYVPGPNPALGRLLESGFWIEDFELHSASSSAEATLVDPTRVLPSHDLL